jgi:hypothetical protein
MMIQNPFLINTDGSLFAPPPPETIRVVPYEIHSKMMADSLGQLSLWWTALGIAVGVLAILFTVGTIAVTFMLFRQSREYREQADKTMVGYEAMLQASIANYQGILNGFVEEKTREVQERLEVALQTAEGEARERIANALEGISRRRVHGSPMSAPTMRAATSSSAAVSADIARWAAELERLRRGVPGGDTKAPMQPHSCGYCGGTIYFSGERDPKTGSWIYRCRNCGRDQSSAS